MEGRAPRPRPALSAELPVRSDSNTVVLQQQGARARGAPDGLLPPAMVSGALKPPLLLGSEKRPGVRYGSIAHVSSQHSIQDAHQNVPSQLAKQQTLSQVSFNLIKALLGYGCLALPWCFQQVGFAAGIVTVFVLGWLSNHTISLLLHSKYSLARRGISAASYSDLAEHVLGKPFGLVVKVATAVSCFGTCGAYIVCLSGMVSELFPIARAWVVLALVPVLLISSWIRTFRRLSSYSLFGNAMFLCAVGLALWDGATQQFDPIPDLFTTFRPEKIPQVVGVVAYLFTIHYVALPIEQETKRRNLFMTSLDRSMLLCTLLDIVLGACGYVLFIAPGIHIPDNMLLGMRPGLTQVFAVGAVVPSLVFGYIVMMAPARQYLEEMVVDSRGFSRWHVTERWQRNISRALFVSLTAIAAAVIPSFSTAVSLVGGLTNSFQAFVLPPIIYIKTHPGASKMSKGISCVLAFVGVSIMIATAISVFGLL